MAVRFSTRNFEFSHGRKPRGEGVWAFEVAGETMFTPMATSFTEAKKMAAEWAKEAGVTTVDVLP